MQVQSASLPAGCSLSGSTGLSRSTKPDLGHEDEQIKDQLECRVACSDPWVMTLDVTIFEIASASHFVSGRHAWRMVWDEHCRCQASCIKIFAPLLPPLSSPQTQTNPRSPRQIREILGQDGALGESYMRVLSLWIVGTRGPFRMRTREV